MLEFLIALVIFCALLAGGIVWFLTNPVFSDAAGLPKLSRADADRLEADVRHLAASEPSRAYHNVASLNAAADHIESEFHKAGCRPERQTFRVTGDDYHNIICSFGPDDAPRIVIGAHYDVAGDDNPGADDNASAVAGIIELARLISADAPTLAHRLDLVAFSLEEPPNFRGETMGSHIHARSLAETGTDVRLMISVEMIGYFSDEPGSQRYPLPLTNLVYPDRGDFIGVVGRSFDRAPVARVKALMRTGGDLPVHSINAPALVPGIDFSDHMSYWRHGLPAVMVTDTAFLRNPHYHMPTDTADTLDFRRMAQVVDGLYRVAVAF
ncbi:MAG TPA: M28 family peptidase [Afifellaceae bacterium]|nr:M28 family peptidase [Afifellaceae bacterium]